MSEDAVGGADKCDTRRARTLVALVAAPITGGIGGVLVLFAFGMGYQLFFSGRVDLSGLGNPLWMMIASSVMTNAIVAGVPLSLIAGLPVHLLLTKLRMVGWLTYAVGGGAIALAGMVVVQETLGWRFYAPFVLAVVGGGGAIGGLAFWLIRRPDRDAPPKPQTTPRA